MRYCVACLICVITSPILSQDSNQDREKNRRADLKFDCSDQDDWYSKPLYDFVNKNPWLSGVEEVEEVEKKLLAEQKVDAELGTEYRDLLYTLKLDYVVLASPKLQRITQTMMRRFSDLNKTISDKGTDLWKSGKYSFVGYVVDISDDGKFVKLRNGNQNSKPVVLEVMKLDVSSQKKILSYKQIMDEFEPLLKEWKELYSKEQLGIAQKTQAPEFKQLLTKRIQDWQKKQIAKPRPVNSVETLQEIHEKPSGFVGLTFTVPSAWFSGSFYDPALKVSMLIFSYKDLGGKSFGTFGIELRKLNFFLDSDFAGQLEAQRKTNEALSRIQGRRVRDKTIRFSFKIKKMIYTSNETEHEIYVGEIVESTDLRGEKTYKSDEMAEPKSDFEMEFDLLKDTKPLSTKNASVLSEAEVVYWGPKVVGRRGEIVYKIELPKPLLKIDEWCFGTSVWNAHSNPVFDKSASGFVDVSLDQKEWIKVQVNASSQPLQSATIQEISDLLRGHTVFFVRAKINTGVPGPREIRYSQFLRQTKGNPPKLRISLQE